MAPGVTDDQRDPERLHTYMVQRHRMRVGSPLTFSDGERVIAVLSSSHAGTFQGQTDIDVTMLVEVPAEGTVRSG